VKDLDTEEEKSVAGVAEPTGVYVVQVPRDSAAGRAGIAAGDAILAVDGAVVSGVAALREKMEAANGTTVELHVVGARDRRVLVSVE
jgi:S1-C subfamily serine protease